MITMTRTARQSWIWPGEKAMMITTPAPAGQLQKRPRMPAENGADMVTSTAAAAAVIGLCAAEKTYRSGRISFRALNGVDLAIAGGEIVAITGPSGSGKTTIINLIAGIDRPTAGTVMVNGSRLDQMTEEQLAVWRGRTIGIVFQFFQLMPTLTAAENAALPLELSGGEQQRAAIARAMACGPPILLGDEPTGSLDTGMARDMFDLLKGLNDNGTTVVYVTHDQALAALASRIIAVRDGSIVDDTGRRP